jgi:argininosuccinate lyase
MMFAAAPQRYPYLVHDGVDVEVVDTGDPTMLVQAGERLARRATLAGVTSSSEYFIAGAAHLAGSHGLPAPDPVAVANCRDKWRQRRTLAAAGIRVPRFAHATSVAQAAQAAVHIGLPVVVKPVAGSGSAGVRLCSTDEEVRLWAAALLADPETTGRMLVEQYVPGAEFSVETFDDRVVAVIGKHLGPVPHFVEIGHDLPAAVSGPIQRRLGAVTLRCLGALGLGFGAAHTELRVDSDGIAVVEVNPRLAGGMIPAMIKLAGGPDLVDAVVAKASGQPVPPFRPVVCHGAIRFLVADRSGVVVELPDADLVRCLPGVADVAVTATVDTRIGISHSFRDRLGYVICVDESGVRARREATEAVGVMQNVTRIDTDDGRVT